MESNGTYRQYHPVGEPYVELPRGAEGIIFDLMFPERQMFRSHLGATAMHVLARVMLHVTNSPIHSTFPSTADGVAIPWESYVKVGD